MSLWTPYLEEPMDLTKQMPKRIKLSNWPLHEESSNPEDFLRIPAYSPTLDATQERIPAFSPIRESTQERLPVYSCIGDTTQERVPLYSPHKDTQERLYSPLRDTSSPTSVSSDHVTEDPEYQAFERDALRAMAQSGRIVQNNPRMRRDIQSSQTDDQYRQQRQRNNMAAKMSRDRRKMREVKLGIQVAYLTRKLVELQNRLAEQMYDQPYLTGPSYSVYKN
ncbi:transcription factor VBP-like [Aricia agestis]|uniref:transcription factor VBP-like n=1 Tax=Aricia agestis TaxID=91739 RepID=UPI001C2044E2|nr:transcription factor VBP-like [Aricia agestis]